MVIAGATRHETHPPGEIEGPRSLEATRPRRKRKLLLHLSELNKLKLAIERKGMTIVPLEMYFNAKGIAKLKIGLAEGKKLHDKRESDKKRDWDREKSRIMRDKG